MQILVTSKQIAFVGTSERDTGIRKWCQEFLVQALSKDALGKIDSPVAHLTTQICAHQVGLACKVSLQVDPESSSSGRSLLCLIAVLKLLQPNDQVLP